MDYVLGERAEALRHRLRELIDEHVPDDFLGAFTDDPEDLAVAQRFCKLLAAEGLLAMAWPKENGGGDGSVWEQTIVREEMWAHHEPRGAQYMGINWVGPAIMRFGTAEQQAQHLPPIAAGDVIWCQGFSEPDAGSDLASLTTRAQPDPSGGWRISGQKIWTSYALMAQWCILAARTSPDKHHGITMFLVPMEREGITARPIASMLGPHHLNEMFLDEVHVGPEDVLGEIGQGWTVIREALKFERVGIARYARCDRLLTLLRQALGDRWHDLPGGLRARWARALVQVRVATLLAYRVIDAQDKGRVNDADASIARVAVTLCDQDVAEVLFEALGGRSLDDRHGTHPVLQGAVEDHWRYAQAATVASGTIEIQRMLVARAALNGSPK
ncbi:MAG TPA: acyl-CoA dehydrogenase family protein [Acidimicrobiales bacterium]|nr:acyl-CoA dehydrogenase family protein [Acidimicrobiales bacterium]